MSSSKNNIINVVIVDDETTRSKFSEMFLLDYSLLKNKKIIIDLISSFFL